ncbi:hypothetical protein BJX76DRAFT_337040 [Aspergillus varians]
MRCIPCCETVDDHYPYLFSCGICAQLGRGESFDAGIQSRLGRLPDPALVENSRNSRNSTNSTDYRPEPISNSHRSPQSQVVKQSGRTRCLALCCPSPLLCRTAMQIHNTTEKKQTISRQGTRSSWEGLKEDRHNNRSKSKANPATKVATCKRLVWSKRGGNPAGLSEIEGVGSWAQSGANGVVRSFPSGRSCLNWISV